MAWVRQRERLPSTWSQHPRLEIWTGGLEALERYRTDLTTIDALIHPVTSWGGPDCFQVNCRLTQVLFQALAPARCRQIHYFSTASLLNAQAQIWPQVWTQGSDYIRSKACQHHWLQQRFTEIPVSLYFPTLILGGDAQHPLTPLSTFLPRLPAYLKWARYLKAEGSFHFIHARDIARIVVYRLQSHLPPAELVLGNAPVTVNELMRELLDCFGLAPSPWQVELASLLDLLVPLLSSQMTPWDRFSLQQRNTTYAYTNAATYGLHSEGESFSALLKQLL